MKAGTKCIIRLPKGWEANYTELHPGWISRMNTLHDEVVNICGNQIALRPHILSIECQTRHGDKIFIPMKLLEKVPDVAAAAPAVEAAVGLRHCPACDGWGKHRLMCPLTRKK